ncbi:hypothetical protein BJ508DRAFT_117324 [Ascobolus immersus RN42]|uniref:Transmembrane protein n=1 Tax=Ascobolus immersus RN42 TaxID=1160509 RepID=A0A3N4I934_ASCIM|nr:hypothetical protein BJ508DRAFT_117324 [Ascobolus immersus RN42]
MHGFSTASVQRDTTDPRKSPTKCKARECEDPVTTPKPTSPTGNIFCAALLLFFFFLHFCFSVFFPSVLIPRVVSSAKFCAAIACREFRQKEVGEG